MSNTDTNLTVIVASKVPPVTIAFWIVKILATTVGETGGDALSMTPGAPSKPGSLARIRLPGAPFKLVLA